MERTLNYMKYLLAARRVPTPWAKNDVQEVPTHFPPRSYAVGEKWRACSTTQLPAAFLRHGRNMKDRKNLHSFPPRQEAPTVRNHHRAGSLPAAPLARHGGAAVLPSGMTTRWASIMLLQFLSKRRTLRFRPEIFFMLCSCHVISAAQQVPCLVKLYYVNCR